MKNKSLSMHVTGLICGVSSLILHLMNFSTLQLGIETVPVIVGPVSYLLLSKPAKGVEKSFSLLSLINKILPIYK